MLKGFKNPKADYVKLDETHAKCEETVRKPVDARLALEHNLRLYLDMSERFKKVKDEHSGCTVRLQMLEGQNSELSQLLPTVVDRLFRSHEYKQILSEPFNLAIQAGWAKGLIEERSEEDLLELMSRMENFDAYADKKIYVEYDKLFEKRYPYVEKISRGFCHTVSDLLKVYPDSPPSGQAPPSKPSSGKVPSSSAPKGP
ncbi:hypothetical protein Tco_0970726 [Tanacetum coccineum]